MIAKMYKLKKKHILNVYYKVTQYIRLNWNYIFKTCVLISYTFD